MRRYKANIGNDFSFAKETQFSLTIHTPYHVFPSLWDFFRTKVLFDEASKSQERHAYTNHSSARLLCGLLTLWLSPRNVHIICLRQTSVRRTYCKGRFEEIKQMQYRRQRCSYGKTATYAAIYANGVAQLKLKSPKDDVPRGYQVSPEIPEQDKRTAPLVRSCNPELSLYHRKVAPRGLRPHSSKLNNHGRKK